MNETSWRTRIAQILLWISVINFGIYIGGTLYQMLVIVPQWSATIPESLRAWYAGEHVNLSRTIFNFFGPRTMGLRNGPLLAALFFCWPSVVHRKLLIFACLTITAFGLILTLTYIYPINDVLFFAQTGVSLSTDELKALAQRWIWADRLRLIVTSIGYLALLRAFSVPLVKTD